MLLYILSPEISEAIENVPKIPQRVKKWPSEASKPKQQLPIFSQLDIANCPFSEKGIKIKVVWRNGMYFVTKIVLIYCEKKLF